MLEHLIFFNAGNLTINSSKTLKTDNISDSTGADITMTGAQNIVMDLSASGGSLKITNR